MLLFFANGTSAQNIAPNPDLENYSSCPTGLSQVNNCIGWQEISAHFGTADYFNSCSFGDANVPSNSVGWQNANSGVGYCGLLLYTQQWLDYREYLYCTLTVPMVAGTTYDVSFWASLSDSSQFATDDGLEIYFSTIPVVGLNWASPLPITTITPQIQNTTVILDKTNWVQLSFQYVAVGGEQYMTLGNFKTDVNTNLIPVGSGSIPFTYLYVDDFIIETGCDPGWTAPTLCSTDTPINLDSFITGDTGGTWSGTGITGNMFDPSFGTQTITYTAPCNADSTQTIVVTQNPGPIWISTDTSICQGPLILDAQNLGANYTWQDSSNNQTYTVTTSGQYSVEVDIGGCTVSDTFNVLINGPTIDLGPDILTCNPQMTIDALNTGATFLWQDSSVNQSFNVTDFGTYSVDVTLGNCTTSDTVVIAQGSISVILPNDTIICSGIPLTLNAQNVGATYNWSNNSALQSITVNNSGTYWVEVFDGVCVSSDTIAVTFYQPNSWLSISDTVGCPPLSVNFTDLSNTPFGTITEWFWDFGDGYTSTSQHPTHQYSVSGIYDVGLVVTTSNNCVSDTSKQVQITIYPEPIAVFSMTPIPANPGDLIQFFDESVNAQNWLWDFGDGSNSNIQNPTHIYENEGNYSVQLTVSNEECENSTIINISIEEELIFYVPNTFTPDGDQFNNTFFPVFTSGFDPNDYHLTIFNRWGEIVFESYDVIVGWDGTYKNRVLVEDGVYLWEIKFGNANNDNIHFVTGHVTILK